MVLGILRGFRPSLSLSVPGVRQALAAWWPAVAGRGVVQLAGYIDLFLATSLATGAASADRFAQMFYLLPISLFGISVAASELPEMSRLRGEGMAPALLARVRRALRYVAFLNIPTVIGYLAFGFLVVGFYRRGNFGAGGELAGLPGALRLLDGHPRHHHLAPAAEHLLRAGRHPFAGPHRGDPGGDLGAGGDPPDVPARPLPARFRGRTAAREDALPGLRRPRPRLGLRRLDGALPAPRGAAAEAAGVRAPLAGGRPHGAAGGRGGACPARSSGGCCRRSGPSSRPSWCWGPMDCPT